MCILNFVFILATLSDVFGETIYFVPERDYESVRPDLNLERRNFERRSYSEYSRNENFGKDRDEVRYNWTPPSNIEFAARGSEIQATNENFYRKSDTNPNFQLNNNSEDDFIFDSQESFGQNRRQPIQNFNARFGQERELGSDRRIPGSNPEIERHSENIQYIPNTSSHNYNNRLTNNQNININDDRHHSNKQNGREFEKHKNNHNEGILANTHNNKKKLFISRLVPEPIAKDFNYSKSLDKNDTMEDEVNWVWGTDGETETTTDSLGDRVALVGDKCPAGMIRVGGKCIHPV